jgi:hypothetical protein
VKYSREANIPIFELANAVREQNPPNCSGFGVTVPLFGIRLLKGGGTGLNGCSRAGWMMGMRADSTMGIARLTVARAVSVMPIVESAR